MISLCTYLKQIFTNVKNSFLLLVALVLFSSHDMYLKLDNYFLQPNTQSSIQLFNGTFERSDNTIDRDRMADASLFGNGERIGIEARQWSDKNGATVLNFKTGQAGTWVAGVSTHPRNIEMTAADFNSSLEHDGVIDMLEWRKNNDALDQDVVEKYAKHVKTIFQVGEHLTADCQTQLGYPLEFIPLSNPYDLHPGHNLQFELLWQGQPLANQMVYVGAPNQSQVHTHANGVTHSHSEETDADHQHNLAQLRTDADGILTVNINQKGIWYLRTIYLTQSEEPGLTHESNWATLSFEIGDGHEHEHLVVEEAHHHEEEALFGIPSYAYWIASLVLFLALFLWFNRKTR